MAAGFGFPYGLLRSSTWKSRFGGISSGTGYGYTSIPMTWYGGEISMDDTNRGFTGYVLDTTSDSSAMDDHTPRLPRY